MPCPVLASGTYDFDKQQWNKTQVNRLGPNEKTDWITTTMTTNVFGRVLVSDTAYDDGYNVRSTPIYDSLGKENSSKAVIYDRANGSSRTMYTYNQYDHKNALLPASVMMFIESHGWLIRT